MDDTYGLIPVKIHFCQETCLFNDNTFSELNCQIQYVIHLSHDKDDHRHPFIPDLENCFRGLSKLASQ